MTNNAAVVVVAEVVVEWKAMIPIVSKMIRSPSSDHENRTCKRNVYHELSSLYSCRSNICEIYNIPLIQSGSKSVVGG
ncbi:hypothetical protein PUN28_007412 [Cardiocondyla obscurior]|uniref:Uncharacterized protein n=1 Tax=Cardiocondyla obscurior TaxID=286306 RepID=A0AAW2G3T8_9HYME